MWGTCVDLTPGYLGVCRSLAEVDSIKAAKRRLCVYKRAFLRLLTSYCFTNTHGKVVVVRRNVWRVPVWTCIRDISMFTAVWRKLRASKLRKVDCVCVNVLFCDF
jgi:hypothetical protein